MTDPGLRAGAARVRTSPTNQFVTRAPGVLLALLMLTIPLEFTELWFPNQLIQVGRLVMVAAVLTLLVLAVRGGQAVSLPEWSLWAPPAAFIGYALVSALATRHLAGVRTASAALAYAAVAVAIYNWTRTAARQDLVWLWLAVTCIGLSVIAIVQRITGGYIWNAPTRGLARVNATFADPNILGRVLTIMIVAGIATAPMVAGRRARLVMAVAILLSAAALPFTYSRQAWLIGGVALVLAVATSSRRRQALMLGAGAMAVFGTVTLLVPEVQARLGMLEHNLTGPPSHLFERPGLAFLNYIPLDSERHYLIAAGLQMFYDHPLLGLGFGGFQNAILGPYSGFIISGYTTTESHTAIVTILAELGILGLALAAWWGFEYARRSVSAARRKFARRAYVLAPMIAVIVIFLESQLNGRLVDEPYLWVFLGLAWAAMVLEPSATTSNAETSQNSTARSFFQ